LIVRNQLNGSHKQLQAVAQEAKIKTREQRVEFSGGVFAKSTDPQLQMRTDHLMWHIKEEKLFSDRPIQIERYKDNKITGRGNGNAAEINLKTQIAILQPQAKLELLDPLIQIISNSITWNIKKENITTNSPIRIFQSAENVTVTANQGQMQIPENKVYLTGNVNAVGQRRQSLKSNQLTWYLDKQLLEAAADLGANPMQTFWKVTVPQVLPGIAAGSLLVFITGLGDFIDPELLGGASSMTAARLVYNQFLGASQNWGFGSALSMVLILMVSIAIAFVIKFDQTK
jgi:lipopolysaccharide export system protein LptA